MMKHFVIAPSETTPIADRSDFHRKNFCDWMSNREIYENIVSRKFGDIQQNLFMLMLPLYLVTYVILIHNFICIQMQLDPRRLSVTPSKSPGLSSTSPVKSPITPAPPHSSHTGTGGTYLVSAHQRRCKILFLLEKTVALLISQSLRYLLDASVSPHDKQVLKKQLASELVRKGLGSIKWEEIR